MVKPTTELWKCSEDFLLYLAMERHYSANTTKAYRRDLVEFESFISNYQSNLADTIGSIDRQAIRHFLGYLRENGLGARSVARKLAALKSFFKYLNRSEVIAANPASEILTPRFARPLPEFLQEDQAARLMLEPDTGTLAGLRDHAILELFYASGIRLAELVGLNVGDVSFTRSTVRVIGKGNKERVVAFGPLAATALGKYLEARRQNGETVAQDSPLYCGRGGNRFSRRSVQDRVKYYLKQVTEGEHLSPHMLRHSVATHLLDRGADLMAVKDFLGHESLSSTQVYTHVKMDQMKKLYAKAHPHAK